MKKLAQNDRPALLTALETASGVIYTLHSDLRLDISIEPTVGSVKVTVGYSDYLLYNVKTKQLEMGDSSAWIERANGRFPAHGYVTPGHEIWELLVSSSPSLADFERHDGVVVDHVFAERTHYDFYWYFDLPQDDDVDAAKASLTTR